MRSRNARKEKEPESLTFSVRLGLALRRYFVTGLATLFPLSITIWLLVKIFEFADGLLGQYLAIQIPGLGLLMTILVILAVGVLSTHFVGRLVFPTVETWFSRLPVVNKIYPAVKQLAKFLFAGKGDQKAFRKVVLVQYPRPGSYSLAFVTNETQTSATGTPQTLLTLLIPTPPSPFTGPIIFVPEQDVIPLTMTVEEAVKLTVSAGIVSSPLRKT